MRISDSTIDDVRQASDIVDVISTSVRLKKRGKNYLGLCPFHTEKTPSFNVSPEKQMFHCFGCGVGGNVFTFVMQMEKVSFPEAVRLLAERAGITIPVDTADSTQSVNEPLYNACRRAAVHFAENLYRSPEGKVALDYFHGRGFHDETIRKFGLGSSLSSWDDLLRYAKQEGVEAATLEKAGLAIRREDGSGLYDRFRGRAMFPIVATSGRTIGFGARKLREDDPVSGKYINSPETPIYEKSRVLYGLYHSKEAIRSAEAAVIVEGYADLISLYQSGIGNVVASSGTALTDDQIKLIGRYTQNVLLVYDADSAGSKAMMRGVDLIIGHGLDVKVVQLPQGEDPDSFVRKEGPAAFRSLLDKALGFLDFKVEQFKAAGHFLTPEGQTRTIRSIVRTIATMQDELKRNLYIKYLAERHGIYESVLFRELEKQLRSENRDRDEKVARDRKPEVTKRPESTSSVLPAVERDLIKVMIGHGPEMIRFVLQRLSPEDFTNEAARRVLELLVERSEIRGAWDSAGLLDSTTDESIKALIAGLVFDDAEISKGWAERDARPEEVDPRVIVERCIERKKQEMLDQHIAENQNSMKAASSRGEDLRPYLQEHQKLMKQRQELRKAFV